jgi:ubiquinone/menaquinone biosynthesis C-methylase UbiE
MMQSVEHFNQESYRTQESKELLKWYLAFQTYQDDFSLDDKQLTEEAILDVGTGNGAFVHYEQKVLNNQNVYGIDFDQNVIPRGCPYLTVGNLLTLPYPDELFGITLSRNVLHGLFLSTNTVNIQKALSELIRITKKGGLVMYAIKSPERITQAIIKDIQDQEIQTHLLHRLRESIKVEGQYLHYLQSLGNKVSIFFQDTRRIVKIEKRKVQ